MRLKSSGRWTETQRAVYLQVMQVTQRQLPTALAPARQVPRLLHTSEPLGV